MTSLIVHSSSTTDPRQAWATLDRRTLWAVSQLELGDLDAVAELVTEGIPYRLIELTLASLIKDGLVQSRLSSVRTFGEITTIGGSTVYAVTAAGRALVADRATKAA